VNGLLTYYEVQESSSSSKNSMKHIHYPSTWQLDIDPDQDQDEDDIYPLCVEHEDERCTFSNVFVFCACVLQLDH
jgi:hypothetical protein